MQKNPTYIVKDLNDGIPLANLEDIKKISETLRRERRLYSSVDYNNLLTLITRRLIELSRRINYFILGLAFQQDLI